LTYCVKNNVIVDNIFYKTSLLSFKFVMFVMFSLIYNTYTLILIVRARARARARVCVCVCVCMCVFKFFVTSEYVYTFSTFYYQKLPFFF